MQGVVNELHGADRRHLLQQSKMHHILAKASAKEIDSNSNKVSRLIRKQSHVQSRTRSVSEPRRGGSWMPETATKGMLQACSSSIAPSVWSVLRQ